MDKIDFGDCVRKYLDLSTGHITSNDSILLENISGNRMPCDPIVVVAYGYEEGFFIPIGEWNTEDSSIAMGAGFSEAFIALLTACHQQGYDMLRLDRDGPECDALPKFDW